MTAWERAPANQTIVIADDNALYLEILRDLLALEGYPRVICAVGAEAHEVMRREQPALVLLDIHVGHEQQSWSLLFRLRRDGRTAEIPILVCSADHWLLKQQRELLGRLRCDVLAKPFALSELVAKIRTLIGPPVALRG
jgi:two-component system response regulator MprA